jgi:carbamoyltransferase
MIIEYIEFFHLLQLDMSYYLGIFGGQGPNPSAALLKGGSLIAMAEEERFLRIKNAPSALPLKSIKFCLDFAGINFSDIEKVGFGWDCEHYLKTWPEISKKMRSNFSLIDQTYDKIYESRILDNFHPLRIKEDLKFGLAKLGIDFDDSKMIFLNHHKCHAASTFFQSGFDESLVFCFDGSGEEISSSIWHGKNKSLKLLNQVNLPDSLGGFYATFTEFLGFKANSEEGKLMGLAPYGKYSKELQAKIEQVIEFDKASATYKVNLEMRFIGDRSYNNLFTDKLTALFGKPRISSEEITEHHADIAYNVQFKLEEVVNRIVSKAVNESGVSNVCLAGGVAMNCKMNGKIALLESIENVFVQPASSDNGVSIGAAVLVALEDGVEQFSKLEHCYFGPEFSEIEIENYLNEAKIKFTKIKEPELLAAKFLNEGLLLGWFQGRSEFGARALGNRSILANPLFPEMKDKLNLEVKHRENWRPFCPSLTEESYEKYFGKAPKNPFMILAYPVLKEFHSLIPSVVHVDGTARPQSVDQASNPIFHKLLTNFEKLSGHAVLINTSFNVQGEPVVNSPADAIRCFFSTGLDKLFLENFLIEKF